MIQIREYLSLSMPVISPIIVRANGEIESIKGAHRILGVIPSPFTTDQIKLNPKDKLILYSDGITETFSPSEEIFGEKLKNFLMENQNIPAEKLLIKLQVVLDEFRMAGDLGDDMSLIYLKRL